VPNVGTDDQTPTFEEAEERGNIVSGDKLSVLFGKIRKWFTDIKDAAFCSVANNLVTTLSGSVLDARQGKVLDDRITGLYSEMPIKILTTSKKLPSDQSSSTIAFPISGVAGYKPILIIYGWQNIKNSIFPYIASDNIKENETTKNIGLYDITRNGNGLPAGTYISYVLYIKNR